MAPTVTNSFIFLFHTVTLIQVCSCVTLEYKARYYTNATLICDDSVLGLPYTVFKAYWILPDESILQPEDVDRRDKYVIGKSEHFSLTVLNVDDDDFARYVCVILWDNAIYRVHAINVDLDIDGERFSEMYRKNAVIGGFGAAGTAGLLAICYLVYCFRYRVVPRWNKEESEETRVMQALDQAVSDFDDSLPSDADPVLQVREGSYDVTDDESIKNLQVEINRLQDIYSDYDNRGFEIENGAMLPYAESDIDHLPPYSVQPEYQDKI